MLESLRHRRVVEHGGRQTTELRRRHKGYGHVQGVWLGSVTDLRRLPWRCEQS